MEREKEEKKEKNKAIAISLGVHVLLGILFVLIAAWTEPDPPIPEFGIELAFIGQTVAQKSSSSENINKEPIEETVEEEQINEAIEEQEAENIEPSEVVEEQIETISEEPLETLTEDINSSDVNPEDTKLDEVTNVQEEQVNNEDNVVNEDVQDKTEQKVVHTDYSEEEPESEIDERAIFQNNTNDSVENSGKGSIEGGSSLNMSGWVWDFKPEPDDQSIENGKIIFRITVDDEGEIIGIQTLEKTVSPSVEKVYKNAVMDLTFSKTADNKVVAANSKGIITFIIKSK